MVSHQILPLNLYEVAQALKDAGIIRNVKLHYRFILAGRSPQTAESIDKDFKWSLLNCLFRCRESMIIGNTH